MAQGATINVHFSHVVVTWMPANRCARKNISDMARPANTASHRRNSRGIKQIRDTGMVGVNEYPQMQIIWYKSTLATSSLDKSKDILATTGTAMRNP
eukprot:CAMPEP_0195032838 /NCGR_PEP_ID=MMETSP0326_2-20130528/64302_1 /TAXON_ID=2866 ORGANISM="Crypthecodinium cohnii, Strain Seligo" /NCGR_SAMPLE_ID=MMETSP0326_2 /ASSEMBLY_ACC=CAM_ASM_000348 /LENGTH=96 /DNA_ID=CAMNT_0040057091 /DNA_START=87 /DNA_END=377 /DNA_ORIENTATION=-